MTQGTGRRQYRACVRCRTRKTRCDLQSYGELGKPPCAKCTREGAECVLAGSRRGGDYSHHRRGRNNAAIPHAQAGSRRSRDALVPPLTPVANGGPSHDRPTSRSPPASHSLQNPSDALLILAHAAGEDDKEPQEGVSLTDAVNNGGAPSTIGAREQHSTGQRHGIGGSPASNTTVTGVSAYPLVRDGTLDQGLLNHLLRHYADNHHPFFPIVSPNLLRPASLLEFIEREPFLLTAVLVVASSNRRDFVDVNRSTWSYMRHLLLDVVLGMAGVRNVGCVEGLLLLGEWTPLHFKSGNEDGSEGAAWSLLGLAVRLAYHLRLEDSSFKGDNESDTALQRRRLAWTFTYLLDRQISIRLGQAFWCRGPALSARFRAEDFPSLQPQHARDEDYASLLQAQVELTTLFGNAHDILFASKQRTAELMTRGDYVKYIDDAMKAAAAWQHAWQHIAVSDHLRRCLTMMQHYLRLYVNAFAFQAVLYRASKGQGLNGNDAAKTIYFPDSTMASPDARNVYEAMDAAEVLLKIVIDDICPEKHLRYMPARFYLYEIHSAVFLYKAHASGASSSGNHAQTSALIKRFIYTLEVAATGENHIAFRYAKLLRGLWFRRSAPATNNILDSEQAGAIPEDTQIGDPMVGFQDGMPEVQMPLMDDLGLPYLEGIDTIEGLFSMPATFPWDQSIF